jgi:hypothetical protein
MHFFLKKRGWQKQFSGKLSFHSPCLLIIFMILFNIAKGFVSFLLLEWHLFLLPLTVFVMHV